MASFFYLGEDQWKPDINMLKLCCSNKVIGVCTFNMSHYINKAPYNEKAYIKSESYQEQSEEERVLKGNAEQYPGAYIEFRLKV